MKSNLVAYAMCEILRISKVGTRIIKDGYHERRGWLLKPAGGFAMTALTGLMHVAVSDSLLVR